MKHLTLLFEAIPPLPRHWFFYLMNLYPPFLGAGIRICRVEPDLSAIEASLRLRWWNRNTLGTHFGGSIYALCDPFHVLLLTELLGPGYMVRDKGAEIKFLNKGKGRITTRFSVDSKTIAEIWNSSDEVQERRFSALVRNESGEVVAEVFKIVHIRRTTDPYPSPKLLSGN